MSREYLLEVGGLVWPAPASVELGRGGRRGLALVPSAAATRLALPAGSGRAAATACRSYAEARSPTARARSSALGWLFRGGLGGQVFRDRLVVRSPVGTAGLPGLLAEVLGRPVQLALWVGPARATRKPVLQVLGDDGALLAVAKLGRDPLTDGLVRAESEALGQLERADLTVVHPPHVLHAGEWSGHPVLVQSALPVWQRRVPDAGSRLRVALTEIAGSGGIRRAPVTSGAWWTRLAADVERLAPSPAADQVRSLAGSLGPVLRDERLLLGSWHGDFNPGNFALVQDGVLVWDWERFEHGAPVGFDSVHLWLQEAITRRGLAPTQAVGQLAAAAPGLVAALGLDRRDAPLIRVLYGLELAVRYLRDLQAQAGSPLGAVETWLLPSVSRWAAELPGGAASQTMSEGGSR